MSSHYVDIQLRPYPEVAPHQLMSSLYQRLHLALVNLGEQRIGVSFPGHDEQSPSLGSHMRLHGPIDALTALQGTAWLRGIRDHLLITDVASVPSDTRHRQVLRVQVKSNAARLRRRAMKRHGLDETQAAKRIPDSAGQRSSLPFVTLASKSTGQHGFPLFVRHGPVLANPLEGAFNSYGLSLGASVPWF